MFLSMILFIQARTATQTLQLESQSSLFSSEHSKILQKLLVIAILLNKRDLGFHNKYLRYSLMKLRNSFCTNMAVNALRENSEAETNLWTKCPAYSWATVLLSG